MTDQVRFNMRFPHGVRDQLSAEAKRNGISRNKEIVRRLRLVPPASFVPTGVPPVVFRGSDQTIVFMPRDLHAHLVLSAQTHGRSLQSECIFRLMASLAGSEEQVAETVPLAPIVIGISRSELQRVHRRLSDLLTEVEQMMARAAP